MCRNVTLSASGKKIQGSICHALHVLHQVQTMLFSILRSSFVRHIFSHVFDESLLRRLSNDDCPSSCDFCMLSCLSHYDKPLAYVVYKKCRVSYAVFVLPYHSFVLPPGSVAMYYAITFCCSLKELCMHMIDLCSKTDLYHGLFGTFCNSFVC